MPSTFHTYGTRGGQPDFRGPGGLLAIDLTGAAGLLLAMPSDEEVEYTYDDY
jgi:hypothetical protein